MSRWLPIFVFMALALGLGTAQAAWTYMGHLDGHAVLIDRNSIELKKRNALVWMLTNYSTHISPCRLRSSKPEGKRHEHEDGQPTAHVSWPQPKRFSGKPQAMQAPWQNQQALGR